MKIFKKYLLFIAICIVSVNADVYCDGEMPCVTIQTNDDINQDVLNNPMHNIGDIDYNSLVFNANFYNDMIGYFIGDNNTFKENMLNYGMIEGNDNIFEKKVINDGYFYGKNFIIKGGFENKYDGFVDGSGHTFGDINSINDKFDNFGLLYGDYITYNYDFFNSGDNGFVFGEFHTFNKNFQNDIGSVVVGIGYKFNGSMTNEGEMYSNAFIEDDKFVFNSDVINRGYMHGNYSDFNGSVENFGEIFGKYNTFLNLTNHGDIYIDGITVKGDTINGSFSEAVLLDANDIAPTIYGENNTFNGKVSNYAMLLGSNVSFNDSVVNGYGGWLIGDNFIFNKSVQNDEFGDIVGSNFVFNEKIINKGTIDVLGGSLKGMDNSGTVSLENYFIDGDISNAGSIGINRSFIKTNITSNQADKSSLILNYTQSKSQLISSSDIDIDFSKIYSKDIIAWDSFTVDKSLILTKSITADSIKSSHSVLCGKIRANTLNANDSIFMLYQDRNKSLLDGFGGSIVVYDDISGNNNRLQIINLNLSGIGNHFIPILIAKSKNGIDKNFFEVQTVKNLSRFGIDEKYYKFEKIGDYYVAGLGNINLLDDKKLDEIILKLKNPTTQYSNDELLSIINGDGSVNWVDDGDTGLVYLGADENTLKPHLDFMQSKVNTIYVLQNSLFKRLGDVKQSKKNGVWTRYYQGKISYKDTTNKYSSKSIGFDRYQSYDNKGDFAGVFVYDLHSSSKDYSSKSYGFGGYYSLMWDSGLYFDGVVRYTDHNDTVYSEFFGNIFSDYYSVMASVESGYEYLLNNGFYIKPSFEMFYTFHPRVVNSLGDFKFILDKSNDISFDVALKSGYRGDKFMIGGGVDVYFDIIKTDRYGIYDGYAFYDKTLDKDGRLNLDLFGSYMYNGNLIFSFDFKKGFLSDFKLDYEANFNIRYHY